MIKEKTKGTSAAVREIRVSIEASGCLRAGRVLQLGKKGLWGLSCDAVSLFISSCLQVHHAECQAHFPELVPCHQSSVPGSLIATPVLVYH